MQEDSWSLIRVFVFWYFVLGGFYGEYNVTWIIASQFLDKMCALEEYVLDERSVWRLYSDAIVEHDAFCMNVGEPNTHATGICGWFIRIVFFEIKSSLPESIRESCASTVCVWSHRHFCFQLGGGVCDSLSRHLQNPSIFNFTRLHELADSNTASLWFFYVRLV